MFNVDLLSIDNAKVLVIGSKKKVGREVVKLLKKRNISYGRVINRYHIDVKMNLFDQIINNMSFNAIIDLSNDLNTNFFLASTFPNIRIIRTYFHDKYGKLFWGNNYYRSTFSALIFSKLYA